MKTTINQGTLDDIEFPKVLYKYRSWNNKNNKRSIINKEVFMASPNQFDDKLDCKIPIRYDLMNKEEAKKFYTRLYDSPELNWTRKQKREELRKSLKQRHYLDSKFNENYQKEYFKKFFKRIGILSLTPENCLEKMWEKYADKQKGFCIGYNSRTLFEFLGGGGKVEYTKELPILMPEPIMSSHVIERKQVYSKEQKWEFEKEYRTQKFWGKPATKCDRQISLPKEAFNCVILGKEMNKSDRIEIIDFIKNKIGNIDIKEQKNVC